MTDGESREDVLKRRKIRRRIHYLSVTGSIIAIGFALYALLYSRWARIQTVQAQVHDDINQAIVQDTWQFINGQKLIAIPNTNALFLNRGMLNATLVEKFPEMRNFDFIYNVPQRTLLVRATPRETAALLCNGNGVCYAIDDHSIPFKIQDASSSKQFLQIDDQSGLAITLGVPALPEEYFESLIAYWNDGQRLHLLTNAAIEKDAIRAGYIKFDTSQGWYLEVKAGLSPQDTYAKISTVLQTTVKDPTKLKYIDARYTDKLYTACLNGSTQSCMKQ